ncbi:putative pentatricopeptide repeat-containing protein [Forsythia ovata]|uniref:Pentatricopeptide repeat-containing protein n=1 Tax=Forsythia ovata TaxID=205694 RepID=A0ABD1P3M6_9LAMI
MDDAISSFSTMLNKGPVPNVATYSGEEIGLDIKNAFELYEEMLQKRLSPTIVSYNILIDSLCKRGLMEEAYFVFHNALNRGLIPDIVAYTILIRGYCKVGRFVDAMLLYKRMLEDGISPP